MYPSSEQNRNDLSWLKISSLIALLVTESVFAQLDEGVTRRYCSPSMEEQPMSSTAPLASQDCIALFQSVACRRQSLILPFTYML